jgi:hypothetical protein
MNCTVRPMFLIPDKIKDNEMQGQGPSSQGQGLLLQGSGQGQGLCICPFEQAKANAVY